MGDIDKVAVTDTFRHSQRIPGSPYQTIRELAKNSGLAEYYIRQLHKKGLVPGLPVGSRYMVNVPRFEEYLDTLS